jgi:putative FmdB family regulatory protein
MPGYEHICEKCQHEWEESYSIKANPPTLCPSCNEDGFVKRLISGGNGRGIVILTGGDLRAKLQSEGQALRKAASKNENLAANLYRGGEAAYHEAQLSNSAVESDLFKIGSDMAKVKSTDTKPTKSKGKSKVKRIG